MLFKRLVEILKKYLGIELGQIFRKAEINCKTNPELQKIVSAVKQKDTRCHHCI